ncbi:MAG: FAD-linked oxidase C-terminal domain-containing protein [Acidimicrobiia bacterium]|nr:FAD-linked oxidase C-terminal domain-containing protein [Acidimicrobiia bacterium]
MSLVDDLVAALGADRVKAHPLELRVYDKDAGVARGPVAAVALPESTAEVVACVKAARTWGVPIVARGAGTGLAGGAVPTEPALIVALTRMNTIHEVDLENRTAWVGPGVINLDLSAHTTPMGFHYAPDPSSQSVCTIGGNVGTNAGGPHCLAEGTTVAHILAVEMVTVDGEIVELGGPAPDPIGLDLRAVVVGSEGTMGLVTRVLVKLTPNAPDVRTLLLAYPTIEGAAETVSQTIAAGIIPAALEIMDRPMVQAVENFVHAGYPTESAAVLLAEVTGHPAAVTAEAGQIERIALQAGTTEVRSAVDAAERDLLWLGRKSAFGAVAQSAPDYYLHDTVVPRTRLVETMTRLYEIADRFEISMLNVFHAGDGNLHPLVAFDGRDEGARERVMEAAEEMVRVSLEVGGSLSGEHGIGLEKRDLMADVFSPIDLDAQARLRDAFDPDGALNPGKILPHGSRCYDFGMQPPLSQEPAL